MATVYENSDGHFLETAPSVIMSTTEFASANASKYDDGTGIEVCNLTTNKVVGYYVVYQGHFVER